MGSHGRCAGDTWGDMMNDRLVIAELLALMVALCFVVPCIVSAAGNETQDFIGDNTIGIAPLTVTFTSTSEISNVTDYQWNYMKNSPGTWTTFSSGERNATFTFTAPGSYWIMYTEFTPDYESGYLSTTRASFVVVSAAPVADFTSVTSPIPTFVPTRPVADFAVIPRTGTSPLTVNLIDASTGDGLNYFVWSYRPSDPAGQDWDVFSSDKNAVLTLPEGTYDFYHSVRSSYYGQPGENSALKYRYVVVSPSVSPTPTQSPTPSPTPTPTPTPVTGSLSQAVFRPASGNWYLDYNRDGTVDLTVHFGKMGDIPVPADYNGDGITDIAIFRPASGMWYFDYNRDGTVDQSFRYGKQGDIPLFGKWT